ncbi:hypothetical protein BDZ94DRAFT_1284944 [Collybia nuda]|uniref:FAD-binding PCMH-type domain-containing protein n=1 Tax=Collybia nuda TaxID=64659 RepID=A0A9P5XYW9_9AGAR|nr:hypothetical protein BDZ94DRAFT_1284944 [Collybia nuda]
MKIAWLVLSLVHLALSKPSCRCLYGEACWPKESDFSDLALQLSQPLLYPKPPGSACYPANNPSGNCSEVMLNALHGRWRSDQPGSMQAPNFETFMFLNGTISACYINATLGFPCTQGSVPEIGVNARTIQDVQATVKFASTHNLRLVVKNTGHDYLGRSTARGGLLLWTHNLKNVSYNPAFVPSGAPPEKNYKVSFLALTVGAGVQWYEAYDAAQAQGRVIVGGAGSTVGAAGGWIMGGGHSPLSGRHGLGVDNIIEFGVVTADGAYRTVNAYKNPDLFWALRGGGGGTYAVVLSATYETHDPVPLTTIIGQANFTSPTIAKSVITEFVRVHPTLADAGWGGYSFLSKESLSFAFVAHNVTVTDASTALEPFLSSARNATGGGPLFQSVTLPYDSFYTFYLETFITDGEVGTNMELGSRLLPHDLSKQNPEKVAEIMLAIPQGVGINFVAGGAVSKVDPETTGLHPDWRKAIALVFFIEGWVDGTPASDIQAARARIRNGLDTLDGLAPGSATYFNEASLYEKNPQKTFFGSHYKKLKDIKDKYDPMGLFIVASGVSSEDWDGSLNCRLN